MSYESRDETDVSNVASERSALSPSEKFSRQQENEIQRPRGRRRPGVGGRQSEPLQESLVLRALCPNHSKAQPSDFQVVLDGHTAPTLHGRVLEGKMYEADLPGPMEGRSSEAGLCPREDEPRLLSKASREGVEGKLCFSWNQSLRLWLLVLRDKVVMLIW